MRMFLVSAYSGFIYAEITAYDKKTNKAHFRHANGVEYDRIFLPNAKYNREDYRLVKGEDLDDAQLTQLREGYSAGEAHCETAG